MATCPLSGSGRQRAVPASCKVSSAQQKAHHPAPRHTRRTGARADRSHARPAEALVEIMRTSAFKRQREPRHAQPPRQAAPAPSAAAQRQGRAPAVLTRLYPGIQTLRQTLCTLLHGRQGAPDLNAVVNKAVKKASVLPLTLNLPYAKSGMALISSALPRAV